MDAYEKILESYPDPMSRSHFREAVHIGTRTSLYLLQSGLVPCINTGKKTRCYKIAKKDIIDYLKDRERRPHYYLPPSKWYNHKNYCHSKTSKYGWRIDYTLITRKQVAVWYEQQFK